MKISIIVPVYNVAKYLKSCIQSILNQTYEDLEIILINDGSTDESYSICESFAENDSRIILINQHNQGLSYARNVGIEVATGEYLMFVDSDDWVHPRIVEDLLDNIVEYKVKLAMCNKIICKNYIPFQDVNKSCVLISVKEAIPRMLKGEWISAWAKLYHHSLFSEIRFPVGVTNEDYAILIYLFEQCDFITYNKNIYYYYYVRPDSICTSKLNIHKFDEVYNAEKIANYVMYKYPMWKKYADFNLMASLVKLISTCLMEDTDCRYKHQLAAMRCCLKENIWSFSCNSYISWKFKLILLFIFLGNGPYKFFLKILLYFQR